MLSVDLEVARINVVTLHSHLEDLRLVNGTFLHKVDNLVLHCNSLVHVVLHLHLQFILQLTVFLQELLIINWVSKIFVVLSEEVKFTVVDPGVVAVAHRVHGPDAAVFTSTEKQNTMNLLVKMTPVEHVG